MLHLTPELATFGAEAGAASVFRPQAQEPLLTLSTDHCLPYARYWNILSGYQRILLTLPTPL